jgi:pimeloyl-ACP methyl ester carboxylesterase
MGGILGLALAARHADRIRTLTLVSAPVFIEQQMKERYSLGRGPRIEAMQEMGIREWVAATTRRTRLPADRSPCPGS